MDLIHAGESGHAGAANCLELCRRYYYWPKMHECMKLWVAACYKCAASKPPQAYAKAPLQHIQFHAFNDGLIIDHIEPQKLGKTPRGFRYILTMTDGWSNYLVAVPTRSQDAAESISLIRTHWIEKFGTPLELLSDNYPSFKSKFFKTVLKAFDCKTTHGQPYVSRTTGRAERSNRRINTALRTGLPAGCHRDWDLHLGRVTFILNCLRNRHTGHSANYLVFARELNTPLSILAENRGEFEMVPIKQGEYSAEAYELYKKCKEITRRVRMHADADFCYAQRYHDKNLKGPYFEEGDEVFVLIQCPSHKFGPKFVGPYKISEKISEHLYRIALPNGEFVIKNIGKLKKYVRNIYSPKHVDPDPRESKGEKMSKTPVHRRRESSSSSSDSEEEIEVVYRRESRPVKGGRSATIPERIVVSSPNTNQQRGVNTGTFSRPSPDNVGLNYTPSIDISTADRSTSNQNNSGIIHRAGLNSYRDSSGTVTSPAASIPFNRTDDEVIGAFSPSPLQAAGRYNLRRPSERRPPVRYGETEARLALIQCLHHLIHE